MRPYQAFQVLEALRSSISTPLYRKGVRLSAEDTETTLDVYQQWCLLVLDLGYLHPDTLSRDTQRLWLEITKADVLDLNNAMTECLKLIRLQTYRGFKGPCSRISTHLYSLIRDDLVLIDRGDVFAAKRLIQLFSYTSRLSLKDIDLTQQLLDDYLETESQIKDSFPDRLVSSLQLILKRWLGSFVPGEINPCHGPGGVAEHGRCSLEDKYRYLASDQRLEYTFGEPYWVVDSVQSELTRTSQTIFVPKSYKTFRTISMEPPTLQYFQQGIWKLIDSTVARNGYLRNRIGFHDQTRNQRLAKQGSIDRNYATIDLSAASDSVSYDLVKKLFRKTWLPRYFLATRSTHTALPDGQIIELKKFAPMGSALCFPVETLIFASICELVTRECRVSGQYSVFGDDIIIPTQCVERVMELLETLGFHVNRDKSFYHETCWFRESCGHEYCDGFDVSPMRVSRKYASLNDDVKLTKLIQLANNAYIYQFKNLRYFFLQKLKRTGWIALFSPTCLLADNYTNYHTKKRWNSDLQRIEVRVSNLTTLVNKKTKEEQNESIRYRHWLESTAGRYTVGDGFESLICKSSTCIQSAWQRKPYEIADRDFIELNVKRRV